jgi:hypothetical protein
MGALTQSLAGVGELAHTLRDLRLPPVAFDFVAHFLRTTGVHPGSSPGQAFSKNALADEGGQD